MELSNEVSQGLSYLANGSYISDENFKKIVNSCLGLLSGEQNIERISSICPEKSDIIKQIYASLLTFSIEIVRNKTEDEVQQVMSKYNFKSDRIEYFIKLLNLHQGNIVKSLENCGSGWPNLVDVDWKLDYIVKSNIQNHVEGPLYYIVLTTEKNGKLNYIKFTCNEHQLQDFSTKLKEIVCHIEKISNDMTEVWNLWDIKPPPVCTVKTKLHFKEINSLREITYNAIKTLTNFKILDKEAAILSRFLYKNKRIFRHDKGIRNLVKVNQCLKRYLKLNLNGILSTFIKCLPHKLSSNATFAYLPTKGMLKHVLLSLQSFSQIFVRLINLTKASGNYIHQKMCLGWSLNLSFLVFSISARILVSSKFMVTKSIEWYSSMYKCLPYLEETAKFLPDYTFPTDLKKWLGPVDLNPLQKNNLIDNIFEIIDLREEKEDDDENEDEEEVKIVSERLIETIFKKKIENDSDIEEIIVDETKEKEKGVKRSLQLSANDEDLGVPVNEEDISIIPKKKRKKKKMFKQN